MSEGQAFDPSLLDGKDRNELVAIATSLGRKPPARAKKADIVALILELVGADVAAPAADPEAEPAEERAAATRPSDDSEGSDGEQASRQSAAEDRPRGQKPAAQHSDRQQRSQNQPSNNQQGNQQQGGNQPTGDQANEEGEGNRRRRRRGRDRNRQHEDEQVNAEPVDVEGVVDLRDEGYGFLRVAGYLPSPEDAYVSVKQVRQFGLRKGDVVAGRSRAANRNEKNPALVQLDSVNGVSVGQLPTDRPAFDDLTPQYPDELLRLEQPEFPENMTARIVDLLSPIGKGQRGLVVSPPKAGKTTVMKDIIRAVERNHPEVHVMVLLVDERPEEVTDLRRWVLNGEVAASTFDRPSEEHIAVAELVIERAKRLVEAGQDVFVFLDGITRLTRAYNLAAPANGRTMAGGMDSSALYPPKRFFGAARNVEQGGSLTILATALVETNTRLDEVIFEEFKGTGNMELRLDRRLAERRVFPAIDVDGSSTRHEELLYPRVQLQQVYRLRRVLSDLKQESGSGAAGLEMLVERLRAIRTNEAFLAEVAKSTS